MKRKLLVLLSAIFVVSCASNSVEQTKVANKDEINKVEQKQSSSETRNCQPKSTGSRLKRC